MQLTGYMRNGTEVYEAVDHQDMIKGFRIAGKKLDGKPMFIPVYWYKNGQLSQTKKSPWDLIL
jgi:hypothetical protein